MDYYLSMIVGWGPNWAPRGWAQCAGQLMAISSNTALFSLLGTMYGGDGRTTFGLPDLRGRVPIGFGQSPGTSYYPIGQKAGSEDVYLTVNELPPHTHTADASNLHVEVGADTEAGDTNTPAANVTLAAPPNSGPTEMKIYKVGGNIATSIQGGSVNGNIAIGNTGAGQPIKVTQPYQAINFIICLEGVYPSRN